MHVCEAARIVRDCQFKKMIVARPLVLKGLKAVVNTVGGLLASRRVFLWLPLGGFCSYSTNSD